MYVIYVNSHPCAAGEFIVMGRQAAQTNLYSTDIEKQVKPVKMLFPFAF